MRHAAPANAAGSAASRESAGGLARHHSNTTQPPTPTLPRLADHLSDQAVLSYAQEGCDEGSALEAGVGLVMLQASRLSPDDVWCLARHLCDLADQTAGRLIVDVEHVFPLDCTWLDVFVSLHQHCVAQRGVLVLVGLPSDALDMLVSSGVAACLCLADHHDDALDRVWRQAPKPGLAKPRRAA